MPDGSPAKTLAVAVVVAVIAVIAIALVALAARWRRQNAAGGPAAARAVERAGWTLYTRDGCHFCSDQKALLQRLLGRPYGAIINCTPPPASAPRPAGPPGGPPIGDPPTRAPPPGCADPRIQGYPFWAQAGTGAFRMGLQDVAGLRSMAGA